jgi:hypothetical protein
LRHLEAVRCAQAAASLSLVHHPRSSAIAPSTGLPHVRGIPSREDDSGDDDANTRADLPAFLLSEVGAAGEGATCTVYLNRWNTNSSPDETGATASAASPLGGAAAASSFPGNSNSLMPTSHGSPILSAPSLRRESSVDTADFDGAGSPSTTASGVPGSMAEARGGSHLTTPEHTAGTGDTSARSSDLFASLGHDNDAACTEVHGMMSSDAIHHKPSRSHVRRGEAGSPQWVAAQGMRLLSKASMRTTFMQMQQQLHNSTLGMRMVDAVRLRQTRRPWRIDYVGEGARMLAVCSMKRCLRALMR